ncbi:MAG: hypothetical protein KKG78_17155, partial [Alphaproteobacteria bacterium]|nr:hypothetical protein [Alphaproteobacteria bacterium]
MFFIQPYDIKAFKKFHEKILVCRLTLSSRPDHIHVFRKSSVAGPSLAHRNGAARTADQHD